MNGVQRGAFLTVASPGDYGKPRPALVIQSEAFEGLDSLTVLLVTDTLIEAPLLRLTVAPDIENGLTKVSQIMIDKAMTVRRERLGPVFGHASENLMLAVSRALAVFLGIAR